MRSLFCSILLLATAATTYACDVCGAASGGQSLGLLPQYNRHFVAVQYQYRSFSSAYKPLSDTQPIVHSDEQYNTAQLWGRYALGKRVQLFGFLPYHSNLRINNTGNVHMQGIGDATVLANVNIVRIVDTATTQLKHMLQAGVGLKMPTGSYKGVSQLEREGLPNMQPGSGSWDIPMNVNYTIRYSKLGANVDVSYTFTTANKYNYKYGNRLNTQLSAFYTINIGNIIVLPQLGALYEYALHDYDNYDRKWLNEQTGGTILYTSVGAQVYYRSLGMQAAYYQPVTQQYAGGNVTANRRLDVGFMYLFK